MAADAPVTGACGPWLLDYLGGGFVLLVFGEGVDAAAARALCAAPVPCRVLRTVKARELWQRILRAAYDTAEPGVLFADTINRDNTLGSLEHLTATNPCGEIPLPPYGACDLGSLNLTAFVAAPFSPQARLDLDALADAAKLAVRFLDNVIDVSRYPLPAQAEQAHLKRRVGLGITGLADALVLLGLPYDSDASRQLAGQAMQEVRDAAYRSSIELAREKGAFPALERGAFLASGFARRLPTDIREAIAGNVITVLGCHGTDPELAASYADWQFYLQQGAPDYPTREAIQTLACAQGARVA